MSASHTVPASRFSHAAGRLGQLGPAGTVASRRRTHANHTHVLITVTPSPAGLTPVNLYGQRLSQHSLWTQRPQHIHKGLQGVGQELAPACVPCLSLHLDRLRGGRRGRLQQSGGRLSAFNDQGTLGIVCGPLALAT